jgi:tetrahydromethanopterin S-methyltransferase subunit G
MSDVVLVAIITGVFSIGGAIISGIITGIKAGNMTVYRIDQLEKKVDKHNGLVERMVVVEQSCKSAHHRLDELKKEVEA